MAIWSTSTGDIIQRKIDKMFKDLPNVFGIAEIILVLGYGSDGKGQTMCCES